MTEGDGVVREGLLEEVTFMLGPAKERPGREAFQAEGTAGQRLWGRSVPGVFEDRRPGCRRAERGFFCEPWDTFAVPGPRRCLVKQLLLLLFPPGEGI